MPRSKVPSHAIPRRRSDRRRTVDASDDVEFDNDDDTPMNGAPAHTESAIEADVEAKDQLQDDLADDVAEREGVEAGEEERDRISPIRTEGEEDNEDE